MLASRCTLPSSEAEIGDAEDRQKTPLRAFADFFAIDPDLVETSAAEGALLWFHNRTQG